MLKTRFAILLILFCALFQQSDAQAPGTRIEFYGEPINLPSPAEPLPFAELSAPSVADFVATISPAQMQPYLEALEQYTRKTNLDDWLHYQLIRKVAQFLSPKADNYNRYTLYKWWLLTHSGYDAQLKLSGQYLLLYVQSDENVYNIPVFIEKGKQYICLNYHDYGNINFAANRFTKIDLPNLGSGRTFSYKVSKLPRFNAADYKEQEVAYTDGSNHYQFWIKVNPQMKTLFTNYPVVDYSLQFNMPLSEPTYSSLIPSLQKQLKGLKPKQGVDFLMRFVRYAFLFKPDTEAFGSEKRLSPEQTLLSDFSDCEDRSALFFFLVKELYNLPMVVLTYPRHVTVAVQFDKPFGNTIEYNGMKYSVCEPSPQGVDLIIGQMLPELKHQSYQVAYAYQPGH